MRLSRRGFLKGTITGLVIVAAMPDLAEAEARRFWSLDQSMLRRNVWDLTLTPDRFSPGMWAVWSEANERREYAMLPIEVMTMTKPEDLMAHLSQELRQNVGLQATLGDVTYGYSTREGLVYRPIMAVDRGSRYE